MSDDYHKYCCSPAISNTPNMDNEIIPCGNCKGCLEKKVAESEEDLLLLGEELDRVRKELDTAEKIAAKYAKAERTIRSICTILGWVNGVPPLKTIEHNLVANRKLLIDAQADVRRMNWLCRFSYACAFNHKTGKGFIRVTNYEAPDDPFNVRGAIDRIMDRVEKRGT